MHPHTCTHSQAEREHPQMLSLRWGVGPGPGVNTDRSAPSAERAEISGGKPRDFYQRGTRSSLRCAPGPDPGFITTRTQTHHPAGPAAVLTGQGDPSPCPRLCAPVPAPTPVSPASRPAQNHLRVEETAPTAILSGQLRWPRTPTACELLFLARRHFPQRCAGHRSPSLSLCRLVLLTSSAHLPHSAGPGRRVSAGERRSC